MWDLSNAPKAYPQVILAFKPKYPCCLLKYGLFFQKIHTLPYSLLKKPKVKICLKGSRLNAPPCRRGWRLRTPELESKPTIKCNYITRKAHPVGGNFNMIVYKVYRCGDKMNKSELIGVLPERRVDPNRINMESLLKWSEVVFGENTNVSGFFFLQETVP